MTMVYDGLEDDTWKLPLGVMCFSRPQHQFETNKTATLHATPLLEAAMQNTNIVFISQVINSVFYISLQLPPKSMKYQKRKQSNVDKLWRLLCRLNPSQKQRRQLRLEMRPCHPPFHILSASQTINVFSKFTMWIDQINVAHSTYN